MRAFLVLVAMLVLAGAASAGQPLTFAGTPPTPFLGPTARTMTVDARTGGAAPVTARLQPVVGTVQRTGHFVHPHTGRTKYANTVFNPVSGQFATHTFRR